MSPGDESLSAFSDEKPSSPVAEAKEEPVSYSMSPGLSAFLGSQRIALAISSYPKATIQVVTLSAVGATPRPVGRLAQRPPPQVIVGPKSWGSTRALS
jgi:hypothetical protein